MQAWRTLDTFMDKSFLNLTPSTLHDMSLFQTYYVTQRQVKHPERFVWRLTWSWDFWKDTGKENVWKQYSILIRYGVKLGLTGMTCWINTGVHVTRQRGAAWLNLGVSKYHKLTCTGHCTHVSYLYKYGFVRSYNSIIHPFTLKAFHKHANV